MPFRFRRSIRIAPGVRLNIGKRGLSTLVGGRDAHLSVGHGTTRATVSAPGTGVSYTTSIGRRRRRRRTVTWGQRIIGAALVLALFWWLGWL